MLLVQNCVHLLVSESPSRRTAGIFEAFCYGLVLKIIIVETLPLHFFEVNTIFLDSVNVIPTDDI